MTSDHYDTIVIGAGQKNLTLGSSPKRRGEHAAKNKAPVFTGACK